MSESGALDPRARSTQAADDYADAQKARDGAREHDLWIRQSGACEDIVEREFANAQRLDWPGLLGRANSSS